MERDAAKTGRPKAANEPPKWSRRTKVLFASLAGWAILASGLLGWEVLSPGLAPAVWDSDASLLRDLRSGFAGGDNALGWYLYTHHWSWGQEALNWIGEIYSKVRQGQSLPGGFPSATSLNLTLVNLGCSWSGMTYVVPLLQDSSSAWNGTLWNSTLTYGSYVSQTDQVYANVSKALSGVRPMGTDPLAQIGPTGVVSIRMQLGRLLSLTQILGPAIACG